MFLNKDISKVHKNGINFIVETEIHKETIKNHIFL